MHDRSPSVRGRPSFLAGWFRRPLAGPKRDQYIRHGLHQSNQTMGLKSISGPFRLLFISPASGDREAFANRVQAVLGQAEVRTQDFSTPLTQGDVSMAAIVVDCREDQDFIMRILGEIDLLGAAGRPLIALLIRASPADKAWAIAIGVDNILVDPFDDADLRLLLKAIGGFSDLHRENVRLKLSLDEVSEDAQSLRTLAYTDHLTGLPNRLYLANWLNEVIAKSDADFRFAVHMLDLDGFKRVNDQYGHRAGDDILRQVAKRVTRICRKLDLVVRLGGDEIVIVQVGVVSREDCQAFISRLLQIFQTVFELDGVTTTIGASIGSAVYPVDGETMSELLHHADLAMYASKPAGLDRASAASNTWSSRMTADRQNMDRANYSPVVMLPDGIPIGLICCLDKEVGEPLAEEDTALRPLRLACLQSSLRLPEEHDSFFSVPVPHEVLERDDLVSNLRDILTDTKADPARCEILVNASELDREPEFWHQLRELGYGLGVMVEAEDFSPQRLLRVPLTRLHLGASFADIQSKSSESRILLDLAVVFARAAYAKTLAHGVTTLAQIELLQNSGINCVSGPLIGGPVRGGDLPSLWQRTSRDWEIITTAPRDGVIRNNNQ